VLNVSCFCNSVHGFGIVLQRGSTIFDNKDATRYIKQTKDFCRQMHPQEAEMAGIRHHDCTFFIHPRKVEDLNSLCELISCFC